MWSTHRSTPWKLARRHPDPEVVFFAIGFETTAPANAMAVHQARRLGLSNFSLLVSHVRVPPAVEAIMTAPACRVQGFLAAGHVCSVMGTAEYPEPAERFGVPMVVTGFEPLDILEGIRRAVRQLERGEHRVENAYPRAVREEGNPAAVRMIEEVRGHRPVLARHRADPGQWLAAARRIPGVRRRAPLRRHRDPYGGTRGVPQR
ncbi:Hydrogenase maturation factor HypD [Streptomyces afghaniensis]